MLDENNSIVFDKQWAKGEIEIFSEQGINACSKLDQTFNSFWDDISNCWNSKKFDDFQSNYKDECASITISLANKINALQNNLITSYNSYAKANGESCIEDESRDYVLKNTDYNNAPVTAVTHSNNLTGMNIDMVMNTILPNFEKGIIEAISILEELPTSISIFDVSGNLRKTFSTHITSMTDEVRELVTNMKNSIKEAVETEVNTIELAKNEAQEAMARSINA